MTEAPLDMFLLGEIHGRGGKRAEGWVQDLFKELSSHVHIGNQVGRQQRRSSTFSIKSGHAMQDGIVVTLAFVRKVRALRGAYLHVVVKS